MTTPDNIKNLKENQIFVFGSNLNGNHMGGAAKQAKDDFGAIEGIGEGLTGQSYAFPTLDTKIKKVSKKTLLESKQKLYKCAEENKDKQFLVTKLGCGIAGFSEKKMKDIFKGEKPKNIILPAGWAKIFGYKAFEKGLKCRGFQYELKKDFYHKGEIKLCESGFHFCKSLGDIYSYYTFGTDIVVAEVESEGDVIDENESGKSVTNHLRITRILNAEQSSNNNGQNNLGHSNTGHRNIGHWNTGDWNAGHSNTGHWNTGHWNTGHRNTGHRNTGDWNAGHWNTGHWNTGHWNTGHWNTGDRNTGDRNTGDWNAGHWNTGHWNTGFFNTETPKEILAFGKKCSREKWDKAEKPNCLYFDVNIWVDYDDMTDKEKKEYGTSKYTGGYMKKLDYKEAFTASLQKASKEELEIIKKLPNFNRKIFKEISGFDLN